MFFRRIAAGSSLLALFAFAGCGSENKGTTSDPLAGTWSSESCYGSASVPPDVESCITELSFNDDLTFDLTAERVSLPATEKYPGCTTTRRVTGQKWHTDHTNDTVTISGTGNATIERSGCVNNEDNLEAEPTNDIDVRAGEMKFDLKGDTLRITSGALQGTYSR